MTIDTPINSFLWNQLSQEDRAEYMKIRSTFHQNQKVSSKDKRVVTFMKELQTVLRFLERSPDNLETRCVLTGVCFAGPIVCVNTRQLKCFLCRCKSSINGSFQQLGYVALKTKAKTRNCVLAVLPSLQNHQNILRQWTVRVISDDAMFCFVSSFSNVKIPETIEEDDLFDEKKVTKPNQPQNQHHHMQRQVGHPHMQQGMMMGPNRQQGSFQPFMNPQMNFLPQNFQQQNFQSNIQQPNMQMQQSMQSNMQQPFFQQQQQQQQMQQFGMSNMNLQNMQMQNMNLQNMNLQNMNLQNMQMQQNMSMLNSMSMQGMMQNQMQMQQQQQQQFQQMQMMQMQQQFQQQIHNPMLQQQQQHQQPNNPIQNSMKNSLTNPMQIPQPSSISSNNAPHNENDHQSQGQNSQNDVKKVQFMSQMLPPKPASERNVTFGTFVPPSFTSFANHPQPGQLSVSNPHQLDADLEGVDFDQSDDNSPLGTPAPMPTSFSLDFKNMGWDTDDETTSPLLSDSKSNTTITRSRSANVHLADDWDLFPDIF